MKVCYVPVSMMEQNLDLQIEALTEANREAGSGMAAILGVNCSTLQRAMTREFSRGRISS